MAPPSRQWNEEEIALLGTDVDAAIAERIGISIQMVFRKRLQLGIPAYDRFDSEPPRPTLTCAIQFTDDAASRRTLEVSQMLERDEFLMVCIRRGERCRRDMLPSGEVDQIWTLISRDDIKRLLPALQAFADGGDLPA